MSFGRLTKRDISSTTVLDLIGSSAIRFRPGIVTVPFHRRDLKRGTLKSILDQAGLSTDEFIALL
jgi:hypothetical protein